MIWDIIIALGELPIIKQVGYFFHILPDHELESLKPKPIVPTIELEKYNNLKFERNNLKKINNDLLRVNYDLKVLVEKYETTLVKCNKDNIEMTKILDSYREKINTLLFQKDNLHKTLELKDGEIKVLNTKISNFRKLNLELKREIQTLKKD